MSTPHPNTTGPSDVAATQAWQRQWAAVPVSWHGPWVIDAAPFNELFTQNSNYQPGRAFDFRPGGPVRLGQETAWWLWTCWSEGLRKVEPSMLRWWSTALTALAADSTGHGPRHGCSIADFDPELVIREAIRAFMARNGRLPSLGNHRNLRSVAEHAHLLVSVRCAARPWWAHDRWDLGVDDRIPRRPHEPQGHLPVSLAAIRTPWLREAVRYWLRCTLTDDTFRWTTAVTRCRNLATYFDPWLLAEQIDTPPVCADPAQLRGTFNDYLGWLRSPAATTGKPLGANQFHALKSQVQGFYTWAYDHSEELATATADPRWANLTERHLMLWPPTPARRRAPTERSARADTISPSDMAVMASHIEILSTPTDKHVTITAPGQPPHTYAGLGDPQAARAWLLQAMTGRRVSEILMLDYACLTPLQGITTDQQAPDSFVARFRYQQTKVDGIDPTILVDQAVVDLVTEQQHWACEHTDPGVTPTHLFLAPRHNHRGLRPRPYPSHQAALRRLDDRVGLTDGTGRALKFSQTHRLRHARATELLNAGVPVHVVQRYLGHRSPEMTMRYAQTLAATAEAEFLRAKHVGAFGNDLALDARDVLDIAQLSTRADRILPNGTCLLPPAKTCDRGNACLTCGHFATDATHLPELADQKRKTLQIIEIRQRAFQERHQTPMPETNVWLQERRRETASLQAIEDCLATTPGEPAIGAGTDQRHPNQG